MIVQILFYNLVHKKISSQAPKYLLYGEGSTTILYGSTLQAYGNGNKETFYEEIINLIITQIIYL